MSQQPGHNGVVALTRGWVRRAVDLRLQVCVLGLALPISTLGHEHSSEASLSFPICKARAGQMSQFPPKTLNFNSAYRDDIKRAVVCLFARLMSQKHGGLL